MWGYSEGAKSRGHGPWLRSGAGEKWPDRECGVKVGLDMGGEARAESKKSLRFLS